MFKQPDFFVAQNGNKVCLPFSEFEYARRLEGLRTILRDAQLDAALITSMHGVAYYTGFLYCSFGRPYACVVTQTDCTTVSANIDGGQPWRRSVADNVIYTDCAGTTSGAQYVTCCLLVPGLALRRTI